MRRMVAMLGIIGVVIVLILASGGAWAQDAEKMAAKSPWGPDDEIGALNMMTDTSRLDVIKQVMSGKVYDLGVDLYSGMPSCCSAFGDPQYHLWMTHTPRGTVAGTLKTVSASPSQVEASGLNATSDLELLQRQLPAGAFPAVARTLQKEGADTYRLTRSSPEALSYQAENTAHGIAADFDREGVRVSSLHGAPWSWGVALAGYGRRGEVNTVSDAKLSAAANRVEYAYAEGITAWYVNGRLGLQQGFTVARRPRGTSGQGELEVRLGLTGDVVAQVDTSGRSATLRQRSGLRRQRYAGLYVYDSTGRELPARLAAAASGLSILVDDRGAKYPITIDPFIQQVKLTALDGASNDLFGSSVSVSGDTIVVGAWGDDDGNLSNSGSAYVFVKPRIGSWDDATQAAKLTASDGGAGNWFGYSVSISGDTIVVGAGRYDDANALDPGSAYVFVKPSGGWANATQTAQLAASDSAAGDWFGSSVSVSGDTIVVGAEGDDDGNLSNSGSAYVFVKPSGDWANATQTAKLTASDSAARDEFGNSVSVSGSTVVIGALEGDVNGISSGSAYVFERPSEGWTDATQTAKLTAFDGATGDRFGSSVSVSGDTIVVGADWDDDDGYTSGSAYVFERPSEGWTDTTETAKLSASDGAANAWFGSSVSVSGDTIVVGAAYRGDNGSQSGAAYVFVKPHRGWADATTETTQLIASDSAAGDIFGISVSVSGGTIVSGASQDNDKGSNSGSAYVHAFEALVLRQHGLSNSGGWEIVESEPVEVGWIGSAKNDKVSSIIVSEDYTVEVFKHQSYGGTMLTYHGPWTVSLGGLSANGMNDEISSYKLYKTPILFYATPRTTPTFGETDGAETTRQGVNNFCQAYLPEAFAGRDVVAFLTVSQSDTMTNFVDLYDIDPTAVVVGTTGNTIKDSWEALMSEGPDIPIQDATAMSDPEFWSQTYADGSVYHDLDDIDGHSCDHYTSTTSGKRISSGYADQTSYAGPSETGWIGGNFYDSCSAAQHVLCVAY